MGLLLWKNVEELKPEAQAKEFSSVTPSLALQASISARFVCKRPKCATSKLARRARFKMRSTWQTKKTSSLCPACAKQRLLY